MNKLLATFLLSSSLHAGSVQSDKATHAFVGMGIYGLCLITGDNESQVGLVYTELGDGDYSNCELNVFETIEVDTTI